MWWQRQDLKGLIPRYNEYSTSKHENIENPIINHRSTKSNSFEGKSTQTFRLDYHIWRNGKQTDGFKYKERVKPLCRNVLLHKNQPVKNQKKKKKKKSGETYIVGRGRTGLPKDNSLVDYQYTPEEIYTIQRIESTESLKKRNRN